ncbi:ragulator complex protein LAMTOR3-A-like isoform X1 [Biomphalaria glabrata]|uniref:Ragulator complex protein LAMTOR3-A-like isoform X1 n=3 Tax=Biomphalaria TaxID=6525 RepID=A0A2C9M4P0_BIOGL|nr:ragulator complex protein LAMTOR3-A-like isoform X1 [Biomphalaria glabrata]KAI8765219.1 ragulator complex protein LAMTOR3-A-like isoform X1 [Biomphalaria glabrata]KAI8797197.1 ragulator complex protein LAMTOR3-A isoform X1 [Biomphalaria glabrata]KAK0051832.1 ragulator complex protein LAMTOR3-A-like isoform X1 [Biomphalaria pfeifferi]
MTEELKAYLNKLMGTVEGLHAIAVTDRDGVVIVKVAGQMAPDTALRPPFLSVFGVMTEQAGKMGMGTNKRIINFYDRYQTIQVNYHPLLLHFIADTNANTGLILELENELEDVLKDISKVVGMM